MPNLGLVPSDHEFGVSNYHVTLACSRVYLRLDNAGLLQSINRHAGKPGKVKGYNTLVPDYGRRSNGTP